MSVTLTECLRREADLRAKVRIAIEALSSIRRHYEVSSKALAPLSTVYAITMKALRDLDAIFPARPEGEKS